MLLNLLFRNRKRNDAFSRIIKQHLLKAYTAYGYYPKHSVFHGKGKLCSDSFGKKIDRRGNSKVAIIGIPKSGNVWLRSLIADIMDMNVIHYLRDLDKPGVVSFHVKFSPRIYFRKDISCAVYLMRDIRDIIVSYYFYSQTDEYLQEMDPSCRFSDIDSFYYEYFLSKIITRYDWVNHPTKYIERGIPLVKYERLWDDPFRELERLFLRWGIEVAAENIERAIEKNTLANLQKTGRETSYRHTPQSHFRKGGYGGYANVLPDKVIQDINYRFCDYLRRWGYV